MNIESRLQELGIELPEMSKPIAAYVPGLVAGNMLYISGQLPLKNGELLYQGRLGEDLTVEEGQLAARQSAINALAVVKAMAGSWDRVVRIVKITGFIQSGTDFFQQAQVLNGASELLQELMGDRGKHARSAVGVSNLPMNAACEIEMIAELAES